MCVDVWPVYSIPSLPYLQVMCITPEHSYSIIVLDKTKGVLDKTGLYIATLPHNSASLTKVF